MLDETEDGLLHYYFHKRLNNLVKAFNNNYYLDNFSISSDLILICDIMLNPHMIVPKIAVVIVILQIAISDAEHTKTATTSIHFSAGSFFEF